MLFTKPKKAIGIDIGTDSVKTVQMSKAGGRLRVESAGFALVDRTQVSADPVAAQAAAVREALRTMPIAQSLLVGALSGQTVVIRYPRLPDMRESQIGPALENEFSAQNIPFEAGEVFWHWALLDTVTEGDTKLLKVLLVAAKNEVIQARVQIAQNAEIQLGVLTVDSIAMADAAESCDFLRVGETVALVDVGCSSSRIHFVKDGVSNFIRDVNWGSRELIQATMRSRHCDYQQAEKILMSAGEPETPPAGAEALPDTIGGGPAKTGGASLLDPFEDEFLDAPGGGTPAGPKAGASPLSSAKGLGEALAPALSRLVGEIRRSFEFHEHQLFENPVDRLILSGGVAPLPILRDTLIYELNLERVEVADPTESALIFGPDEAVAPLLQRPAQFMVAIGLAARGIADL